MIIEQIRLENWMCFRGEHVIRLEPKMYAVMAQHDGDPDRSNWSGKTSLLEAVYFALYGRHRHQTEDAWITNGEKTGSVEVITETIGIKRSRVRGKATRLEVTEGHDDGAATQERAQERINECVGIDADDFLATCYFEQRQMARMVLARAAERMEIVSSWFRMGKLVECEDKARGYMATVLRDVDAVQQRIAASRSITNYALTNIESVNGALERLRHLETKIAATQQAVDAMRELEAKKLTIAEYDKIAAEGILLKKELEVAGMHTLQDALRKAEVELREATVAKAEVDKRADQRRTLARGAFDGRCPVAQMQCPVAREINQRREQNAALAAESMREMVMVNGVYNDADKAHLALRAQWDECLDKDRKLNWLRERARALRPHYIDAKRLVAELDGDQTDPNEAQRELLDLNRERARLQEGLTQVVQEEKNQQDLYKESTAVLATLATHREAAQIFGKNGAQRRVAENALRAIEADANRMLQQCGIALGVEITWAREGKGLAKTCEECGAPFPASAKVKACERCEAERGSLVVNKLEIALSDRSGAAEDLAGAALQLSASRWLRASRNSPWGVALIDEPYTALDRTHRRAFSTHLARLLTESGFRQGFTISHSPDTADALPGRIMIVRKGDASSVKVVA